MPQEDIALMAHLLRRAGFGATRDELESYAAQGYEATLEEFLHPENAPPALEHEDIIWRYLPDQRSADVLPSAQAYWVYRMINTKRPLEEKMALFWHQVFATGWLKSDDSHMVLRQLDMFRRHGLGSFRTLLVELAKDPSMIFWLDNKDNHKDAVNENFGREILELFSMGVGNYTEDDVRQASRAFTGWTMRNVAYHTVMYDQNAAEPHGRWNSHFEYREYDHDDGEKTFLGRTGAFNGEDIIDIICQQPATARFISRHLYNFFVADEPQVPAWQTVPPQDPEAVQTLMDAFVGSEYDIRSVMRVLFNSDFFKKAAFSRVKSPAELAVGAMRVAGTHRFPSSEDINLASAVESMGQSLLDPASVEGWHTGKEWINSSALVQRVNFASEQFSDVDNPGVHAIIDRIKGQGPSVSPEQLVESCLDLMGPLTVSENTRGELLAQANAGGEIGFSPEQEAHSAAERIKQMLQLIVSTREYQMA